MVNRFYAYSAAANVALWGGIGYVAGYLIEKSPEKVACVLALSALAERVLHACIIGNRNFDNPPQAYEVALLANNVIAAGILYNMRLISAFSATVFSLLAIQRTWTPFSAEAIRIQH